MGGPPCATKSVVLWRGCPTACRNNAEGLTAFEWKQRYWDAVLGNEHSSWQASLGSLGCGFASDSSCRDLARSAQLFLLRARAMPRMPPKPNEHTHPPVNTTRALAGPRWPIRSKAPSNSL